MFPCFIQDDYQTVVGLRSIAIASANKFQPKSLVTDVDNIVRSIYAFLTASICVIWVSSWPGHLGKQKWKFRKRSLPLMRHPGGTITLPSWKHVVYSSALFLWCLSGELMIIVTPTLGGAEARWWAALGYSSASSAIIRTHDASILCPLFLCLCVRATVWRGGAQSAAVLVHLVARPEDSRQGPTSAGIGTGSGAGQRGSAAILRPNHRALQVKIDR